MTLPSPLYVSHTEVDRIQKEFVNLLNYFSQNRSFSHKLKKRIAVLMHMLKIFTYYIMREKKNNKKAIYRFFFQIPEFVWITCLKFLQCSNITQSVRDSSNNTQPLKRFIRIKISENRVGGRTWLRIKYLHNIRARHDRKMEYLRRPRQVNYNIDFLMHIQQIFSLQRAPHIFEYLWASCKRAFLKRGRFLITVSARIYPPFWKCN